MNTAQFLEYCATKIERDGTLSDSNNARLLKLGQDRKWGVCIETARCIKRKDQVPPPYLGWMKTQANAEAQLA